MSARESARLPALACLVLVASCSPEAGPRAPLEPEADLALGQSADRCVNVRAEASSNLGIVTIPAVMGGGFGFGATPFPATLGSVGGEMFSWVVSQTTSGSSGLLHLTLHHGFLADDGVSWFVTDDRAVCISGPDGTTCDVNDVLRVVDGDGIFAGAGGSFRNRGTLDFLASTITVDLRGRVCGDGL